MSNTAQEDRNHEAREAKRAADEEWCKANCLPEIVRSGWPHPDCPLHENDQPF